MEELTKEQKFYLMIKCAEDYIMDKAADILVAIRRKHDSEYTKPELCSDLLSDYKPKFKNNEEIPFEKIIEHFCHELQNYQAMPRAINYASYAKQNEKNNEEDTNIEYNNKIVEKVMDFYNYYKEKIPAKKPENEWDTCYIELYEYLKKDKDINFEERKELARTVDKKTFYVKKDKEYIVTDIPSDFLKILLDENKNNYKLNNEKNAYRCLYNFAWYKYSRGIVDILIQIKQLGGKKSYTEDIQKKCLYYNKLQSVKNLRDNIDEIKNSIKEFAEQITGIGDTMAYDFFKELYCKYLIKDDVHIKECYTKCIDNIENEKEIFENFLELCLKCGEKKGKEIYTPYYIDKILWLCCTGIFYQDKDKVSIHYMTRKDFINYYKEKKEAIEKLCPNLT